MHADFCLIIVLFLCVMIAVNSLQIKMFKGEFLSPERKEFIINKLITEMRYFQNRCTILFSLILMDLHSNRMCNMHLRVHKCSNTGDKGY